MATCLIYPALLNCSRFNPPDGKPSRGSAPRISIRGRSAETLPPRRSAPGSRLLRHCLIETGFNESSEYHEGSSWYAESRQIDPRISSIRDWEKATDADHLFVLEVPWLPTGLSVAQVVERIFRNQQAAARTVASAGDLARTIFNQAS